MDSIEIRARALDAAVRMHAVWVGDTEDDVIASARVFESYLTGNDTTFLSAAVAYSAEPIQALRLTPEENLKDTWGEPCTRCTHATEVHLYGAGCVHPEGCECTWADVNETPPAPEKCAGCARGSHPHVFAKCRDCECTDTVSASAPEQANAPECGCTHRAARHGPETGCIECKCIWTGSAFDPESTCPCGHSRALHSGAPQHCTAWLNAGNMCPCEGYER